ncbi:hypothetical protein HYH02_013987 [Chlamydomonas schloesseri]|uniref:Uncharacterized protein n=1 Tax=Chlamydomonas schloesseri TaxID=2026947 RepID=A0A835VVS0_9CHLO|nr:hypothetical protein HYH02_013987 [Chlamydomonas schloesseri]|eukprot:KAG2429730.1 hypothetical protein HYH02_013987 [Chlamydomonas schloesseri]
MRVFTTNLPFDDDQLRAVYDLLLDCWSRLEESGPGYDLARSMLAAYAEVKLYIPLLDLEDTDLGVELKLLALERLLYTHPEWRGQLVMVQITNPPRSTGRDIAKLHRCVLGLVDSINRKYGKGSYQPVQHRKVGAV